jgi:methyl-accepting chemotaxis protein
VLAAAETTAVAGVDATKQITNEVVAAVQASVVAVGIGILVALLLAIVIAVVITRATTKALAQGVAFATELSDGNLDAKLDVDQKDEIGDLANALRTMASPAAGDRHGYPFCHGERCLRQRAAEPVGTANE